MNEVRRPYIDKKTLPVYLHKMKDVRDMVTDLQDFLMQPGSQEKIYFHEGTHLYYFRKIHPPAKFIPPCIWYYEETGRYEPIRGAVSTKGFGPQCDEARLIAFAKAAVSGGMMLAIRNAEKGASRESILREVGDDKDQEDFRKSCEAIRNASPRLPEFDSDDLWHDAKIKILPDFFDPQIRPQIDTAVTEVQSELAAALYPDDL